MHTATLYRMNPEGHPDVTTPIARITIDDDGKLEIRMMDGTVLVSFADLSHLGYVLMWSNYPTAYEASRVRPS